MKFSLAGFYSYLWCFAVYLLYALVEWFSSVLFGVEVNIDLLWRSL